MVTAYTRPSNLPLYNKTWEKDLTLSLNTIYCTEFSSSTQLINCPRLHHVAIILHYTPDRIVPLRHTIAWQLYKHLFLKRIALGHECTLIPQHPSCCYFFTKIASTFFYSFLMSKIITWCLLWFWHLWCIIPKKTFYSNWWWLFPWQGHSQRKLYW